MDLNKTIKATPLPVNKPDKVEAKLIVLFKYNSVIIILAPQLGIKPIKLVINGPNKLFLYRILDRYSEPM